MVFDLTQGDKSMETPPPNDSSISPPVRGHSVHSGETGKKKECTNNVLKIVTTGYVLPFISKPKLATVPLIHSGYKAHQNKLALASCMESLLSKNVIERVENVRSLWFYSHLFLVPKPHQKWRAFMDLNRLNVFLLVERFKWKHQSPSGPLFPGEWCL